LTRAGGAEEHPFGLPGTVEMTRTPTLLPTTVVGSYPPPEWLVNRELLRKTVARVHAPQIWRVAEPYLEAAQDDATRLAILDMEQAGIDIITDGEIRRESYGTRFGLQLEGVDAEDPAQIIGRTGITVNVPRIVGPIRRVKPAEVRDAEFLRAHTDRRAKITMPGPFTLSRQSKDEFYGDEAEVAMAFAAAINEELHEIKATGVDVIQLDEPWMQAWPDQARRYGVQAVNRALQGVEGPTVIHICFGYAHVVSNKPSGYSFLPEFGDSIATQISIEAAQPKLDLGILRELGDKTVVLGCLDLGSMEVETPETVAARIEAALPYVGPERIVPAPDCGMKYMRRDIAFGKLKALADGAALVRKRLS
jgi:5-methyltetrahydropteroyltriglutamate--homocysteine methyltransferase